MTATTATAAVDSPAVAVNKPGSARRELFAALAGLKREFWTVGLFSLAANALMLAPSLYMLQVFDRVMVSQNGLTLILSTLILVFMLGFMGFAEWARSRLLVRIGVRMDERLNARLFRASFDAQLAQPKANPAQAFNDLTQVRQFLTGNGVFAFFDVPWMPIYLAVLFLLHPLLGAVGLGFALILATVAWFSHRLTAQPMQAALQASVQVSAEQQGKLRNAEAIEALGMLGALRGRWWARYSAQAAVQGHVDELTHRLSALTKFLRYTQQSLSLGVGGWLVIHGELTPGAMIAGNILMTRALQPIDLIVNTWKAFVSARTAFDRLAELITAQPERPAGRWVQVPLGIVELKNVTATAVNRSEPILEAINLTLPAGSVTCVVGPSGSGKSTLARVILGLWPQVDGEVLLDSAPLADWDRSVLGPSIGYLPQDVELMDGTLAQNIARFGEIDSEKVIAAARRADIHDLILRFARGYDTPAGEAGNLLSAGQRQRVALARALYGDPSLVILDEPNANLDDAGEAALVAALQDLKGRVKTVLVMTHRLNILRVADRVLVLKQGRVAYDGTLNEFMAHNMAQKTHGGT